MFGTVLPTHPFDALVVRRILIVNDRKTKSVFLTENNYIVISSTCQTLNWNIFLYYFIAQHTKFEGSMSGSNILLIM